MTHKKSEIPYVGQEVPPMTFNRLPHGPQFSNPKQPQRDHGQRGGSGKPGPQVKSYGADGRAVSSAKR